MSEQARSPILTGEIDSAGARYTIYVGQSNDVQLKIGSSAAGPAVYQPAPQVVDKTHAATATGSLLYLDLTPLGLTDAEFASIKPADPDWTVVGFTDQRLLGMTPTRPLSVAPGGTASLRIGPVAGPHATGASVSLVLTAYRVAPVTVGNLSFPINLPVALVTPPRAGEQLAQDLALHLATPDVVNTVPGYEPVVNQLSLAFAPGPRGRQVKAGADTQFTIGFGYSSDPSGHGALCTAGQGRQIRVVAGTHASGWTITPNSGQQYPSWTLRPPPDFPIVGTGAPSVVGFLVEHVVTTFQPGPTVALVSYSGLPGYADGVYSLLITKQPHVRVTALTVTPPVSVLKDGAAEVRISWTVEDEGTMTLAPFNVDVTGKDDYTATITDTTPISLTAQGRVLASAGNIALANATADVLPVINSFTARPRAVYAGDLPRDVALSWNVNTPGDLRLLSSVGPPDPCKYQPEGTISKNVTRPQMFTLLPLGRPQGPVVEQSVVISAFTPQVRDWSTGAARYLAAAPNAGYVLVGDGVSKVRALDTFVYRPVSDDVPVGRQPAGMVFSADGTVLYVANAGDGTVSVLSVAPKAGAYGYTFTPTATVRVGGSPQQVALSPDGAYLYVTVDKGTKAGELAVLSTGREPAIVTTLPVGHAPRGVAVLPSGAQVFVADSADKTISVVGRGGDGVHRPAPSITGVDSPADVAVSGDGDVLLTTCPKTNSVTAIDVARPRVQSAPLVVGTAPQQLAMLPGGAYAVVTSSAGDGVALVSVGSTPAQCAVLDPRINVGAGTSAAAVAPDGGLVMLGGADRLLVATLAEYEITGELPSVGGQPTDVRVSPDGRTALAWHSKLKWISGGRPSTGVFAYDVTTRTVVQHLAGTEIIDVAYRPSATAATAFLIGPDTRAVKMVDTANWTVTGSIDLAGHTMGGLVALAVSADGDTLFVLAAGSQEGARLIVLHRVGDPPAWAPLGTVTVTASVAPGATLTLTAAPDGTRAYITDQTGGTVLVVAKDGSGAYAMSGQPVPIGDYPNSSALSPDGSHLYVACGGTENGTLVAVRTDTRAVRTVVLPSNGLIELADLAVSPDGNRVMATDLINPGVRIFDAASLRLVQSVSWGSGAQFVSGIAVSPDGGRIFTANTKTGNLGVIDQVQAAASPVAGPQEPSVRTRFGADPYQGLFLRDQLGQTPAGGTPAGVLSDCPDIWPSGQQPLKDPAVTLVGGYGNASPNQVFTSAKGAANFIYVRGLNTVDGRHRARVWLYYLNGEGDTSLILWPNNWLNNGLRAVETGHGYIDVASATLNDVDYTYPPFVWDAVPLDGHYCLVAWVENDPDENPDDPRSRIGSIGTMAELAAFISGHPNLGWRNVVQVPTETNATWTQQMWLTGPPTGGRFYAGVQLTGIPTDGSFAFSIVGPDPNNPKGTVNVPKTPVTDKNQTYMVPIDWTGHHDYKTQMVLTYWSGPTQAEQGANFEPVAAVNANRLVGLVADPLARGFLADVYPNQGYENGPAAERLGQVTLSVVGSASFRLTPL
ncbi:YncE family protein [Actinomadura sp. WMMA1423]|uniref:YncE family protein n=1 Tax=Actinomadura sp. WMMA1423 TaxID=2591108 RepID=UPI0011471D70|nr:YncE family protein [Actinomadura sp. WMMA1423]